MCGYIFNTSQWNKAGTIVNDWNANQQKVGFSNGCFDIIHPGHIKVLQESKSYCDKLVVGLNSDSSVRNLKGDARPINHEHSRAIVLHALSMVDMVVIFADETPLNLIKLINPDLLFKGADYTLDKVVGAQEVMKSGGEVKLINLKSGYSTTNIISKINESSS